MHPRLTPIVMIVLAAAWPNAARASDPEKQAVWASAEPPIVHVQTKPRPLGTHSIRVTQRDTSGNVTVTSAPTLPTIAFESSPHAEITLEFLSSSGDTLGAQRVSAGTPTSLDTPDWAKGIVWYQVFPERFANANPSNDPKHPDSTSVAWDQPFHEPTLEEIEAATFRAHAEPQRFGVHRGDPGAIRSVIFQRRYGGDLMGVLERLDHMQSLGVEGVYLCPVFVSGSLHKYDADDHRHIDPSFGHPGATTPDDYTPPPLDGDPSDETTWSWTESDNWFVETFIPELKSRGMRLMLDGVWNHVGIDHFAFRDVRERGDRSPFKDWFDAAFNKHGELIAWRAWDGINGDLPEFKQIDGDLNPGAKAHVFAVTRRWMDPDGDGDPSDGIDAWRLDVAGEIGRTFWEDWRELVRSINPDALIVGEIWGDAGDYFDGTAFDAQMNYPAAYAIADWLSIGGETKGDAAAAAKTLRRVFSHEPEHDLVQLNLMTSHDTERLASLMHNATPRPYDNDASPWLPSDQYDKHSVTHDDTQRAAAALAALMALPGAVMLYNGDEFALPGADDPDNRRPIAPGVFDEDHDLTKQLRSVARWTQRPDIAPILRHGATQIEPGEHPSELVITRQLGNRSIRVRIGPDAAFQGSSAAPDRFIGHPTETLELGSTWRSRWTLVSH